jgi:hypothetical protein
VCRRYTRSSAQCILSYLSRHEARALGLWPCGSLAVRRSAPGAHFAIPVAGSKALISAHTTLSTIRQCMHGEGLHETCCSGLAMHSSQRALVGLLRLLRLRAARVAWGMESCLGYGEIRGDVTCNGHCRLPMASPSLLFLCPSLSHHVHTSLGSFPFPLSLSVILCVRPCAHAQSKLAKTRYQAKCTLHLMPAGPPHKQYSTCTGAKV